MDYYKKILSFSLLFSLLLFQVVPLSAQERDERRRNRDEFSPQERQLIERAINFLDPEKNPLNNPQSLIIDGQEVKPADLARELWRRNKFFPGRRKNISFGEGITEGRTQNIFLGMPEAAKDGFTDPNDFSQIERVGSTLIHELWHIAQLQRAGGEKINASARENWFRCLPNITEMEAYYEQIKMLLEFKIARQKALEKLSPETNGARQEELVRQIRSLESDIDRTVDLGIGAPHDITVNGEIRKKDYDNGTMFFVFREIDMELNLGSLRNNEEKLKETKKLLSNILPIDDRFVAEPFRGFIKDGKLSVRDALAAKGEEFEKQKKNKEESRAGSIERKVTLKGEDNKEFAILTIPAPILAKPRNIEIARVEYPASFAPVEAQQKEGATVTFLSVEGLQGVKNVVLSLVGQAEIWQYLPVFCDFLNQDNESQNNNQNMCNPWNKVGTNPTKNGIQFTVPPTKFSFYAVSFTPSPEEEKPPIDTNIIAAIAPLFYAKITLSPWLLEKIIAVKDGGAPVALSPFYVAPSQGKRNESVLVIPKIILGNKPALVFCFNECLGPQFNNISLLKFNDVSVPGMAMAPFSLFSLNQYYTFRFDFKSSVATPVNLTVQSSHETPHEKEKSEAPKELNYQVSIKPTQLPDDQNKAYKEIFENLKSLQDFLTVLYAFSPSAFLVSVTDEQGSPAADVPVFSQYPDAAVEKADEVWRSEGKTDAKGSLIILANIKPEEFDQLTVAAGEKKQAGGALCPAL